MPTAWTFRDASPADAAAFTRFAREIFLVTYSPTYTAERMARHVEERFSEEKQRAELRDPSRRVIAALDERGAWAGFALLRHHAAPPGIDGGDPVELERFYVGTAWHGRGLAQALMAETVARARADGRDVVWLGVWEHNARARRFYEKSGFAAVGTVPYEFGGEVDIDTLMVRRTD